MGGVRPKACAGRNYQGHAHRNIVAFCKKHGVSLDWVLYGNLQDHPKKSWERKTVLTPDELRRAYESLGENDKAFISQYLSLLTKKDDAS
jgi:hypothetical protein